MLNECNGCEYQCNLSHIDICTLGSPCPNQRSTPVTEQEWLQTCTTEQFAEFIIKAMLFYDNAGITMLEAIKNAVEDKEKLSKHFIENVVEWLKQPHSAKE